MSKAEHEARIAEHEAQMAAKLEKERIAKGLPAEPPKEEKKKRGRKKCAFFYCFVNFFSC